MIKDKFSFAIVIGVIILAFYSCNEIQNKNNSSTGKIDEYTKENVVEYVQSWPETSKDATKVMLKKYGLPDEVTAYRLIWHDKGDFKEIIVHREEVEHNLPMAHKDVLEQSIYYKVPSNKLADIADFNGSVLVDKTKGFMSARCNNENMNYLVLNLSHEVIIGDRTVREARDFLSSNVIGLMSGDTSLIMQDFLFELPTNLTGDADEAIIEQEMPEDI